MIERRVGQAVAVWKKRNWRLASEFSGTKKVSLYCYLFIIGCPEKAMEMLLAEMKNRPNTTREDRKVSLGSGFAPNTRKPNQQCQRIVVTCHLRDIRNRTHSAQEQTATENAAPFSCPLSIVSIVIVCIPSHPILYSGSSKMPLFRIWWIII
jgi:hypothetical protein